MGCSTENFVSLVSASWRMSWPIVPVPPPPLPLPLAQEMRGVTLCLRMRRRLTVLRLLKPCKTGMKDEEVGGNFQAFLKRNLRKSHFPRHFLWKIPMLQQLEYPPFKPNVFVRGTRN